MTRYMPRVGRRGLDMMKRTATVQANYDWGHEADFVASYQAALVVAPLVAAIFANSPFNEGKPTGAVSERQRVWADTDPARAGFPDAILAPDFSYARYVEWVLDVPMYFVRRDGLHHDVSGASFRTFMTEGLDVDGQRVRATARDWADHLTTLFPEVRAKRVLEVRSADCGPWSRICALPALYKGVLYDDEARAAALALMEKPTGRELAALRRDVAERGFRAEYRGEPIHARCAALVDIASEGLRRQACRNERGQDERKFLTTLEEAVAKRQTFGERLVELYEGAWRGSIAPLWDALEFWNPTSTDM
jgi:glutamate--cysteine ligase